MSPRTPESWQWVLPALLWLLLLAGALWLYMPGADGPAMLDDRASVAVLEGLDENPGIALDYIFGDVSGPLGRPVSMLSFVLEKLYLDEGISGGKKINIVLHLANACLVLWLFVLLLGHARAPAHRWLAVLASAAWLVSPIYVSTVLYVVQRMAMLATLFMLAACISYIYWRLALLRGSRGIARLGLVFMFMVLAVFSKETAIVVLPIVLLMEALWFRFKGPEGVTIPWLRHITLGLIIAGTLFLLLFFAINADWLVSSFALRPFTLSERMLTESRILWEYVGQLYFPDVSSMGLYHDDITISRSLFGPAGGAVPVLAWLGVIVLCVAFLRWQWGRIIVFSAAVFLVGHSTESTILPLELYFEHRNYFPGVGLFLLIAVVCSLLLRRWPELRYPILVYLGIYVLYLATQTGSQVQIWSNTSLLRLNDVNAHPTSFRANADMATEMAKVGELEAALVYSARAHGVGASERAGDRDVRDLALSCMARKPLPVDILSRIGTVEPTRPLSSVANLNVLVGLLQDNACPDFDRVVFADRMKAIFLDEGHDDKAAANIYSRLAALENALQRYDNAYDYIEKYLSMSPDNIQGLLMKLHFSTALERREEAEILKSKLQGMDKEGKLTIGERQTLSLYLEH